MKSLLTILAGIIATGIGHAQSFEVLAQRSFLFPPKSSIGIYFAANTDVRYTDKGEVLAGTLFQDTYLFPSGSSSGLYFAGGTQVLFNVSGEVQCGTLAKNAYLFPTGASNGVYFKAGCQIKFTGKGEVQVGALLNRAFLFPCGSATGIYFKPGCQIQFTSKGEVVSGTLDQDTYLFPSGSSNGRFFRSQTHIIFNSKGEVSESVVGKCDCSEDIFMLSAGADMRQIYDIINGRTTAYEDNVLRVLKRNTWTKTAAVIDVTASMDPYVAQVYLWLKQNLNNNQTQYFTFFNDGDSKSNSEKRIGRTGGIYGTNLSNLDKLLRIVSIAKSNGNGGDVPENDIEAILYTIRKSPSCNSILHIADNNATPRDMSLLNEVTKPVHVIVCGVKGYINPALLDIARKTNGSLHTIEEDIYGLEKIHVGERVHIGKDSYLLTEGGFEHIN